MRDRERRRMERLSARRAATSPPWSAVDEVVVAMRTGRVHKDAVRRARRLGSWSADRALDRVLDYLEEREDPASGRAPWDGLPSFRQGVRQGWMLTGQRDSLRLIAVEGPGFSALVDDYMAEGNEFHDDEANAVASWGVLRDALRGDLGDERCVTALDALERLRLESREGYVDALGGEEWWRHWERTICSSLLDLSFEFLEKPWLESERGARWWPAGVASYAEGQPFHEAAAMALQACFRELEFGPRIPRQASARIYVGNTPWRSRAPLPEEVEVSTLHYEAFPGRLPVAFVRGGAGPGFAGASVTSEVQRGKRFGDWLRVWATSWQPEGNFLVASAGRPISVYEVDGSLVRERP